MEQKAEDDAVQELPVAREKRDKIYEVEPSSGHYGTFSLAASVGCRPDADKDRRLLQGTSSLATSNGPCLTILQLVQDKQGADPSTYTGIWNNVRTIHVTTRGSARLTRNRSTTGWTIHTEPFYQPTGWRRCGMSRTGITTTRNTSFLSRESRKS